MIVKNLDCFDVCYHAEPRVPAAKFAIVVSLNPLLNWSLSLELAQPFGPAFG